MPSGDITHPIPDLSGYITEGQIVLSMELHRAGIYPPVNVSSSLSRLMGGGTGAGKTREDHKNVSDQLYASYAEGKDLRGLVAIVGKDSLSAKDRKPRTVPSRRPWTSPGRSSPSSTSTS